MNINKFITELKSRNVTRVAVAYLVTGWIMIQVAATIVPQFNLPSWLPAFVTSIVSCGFIIALIVAWTFEITPEGVKRSNQVNITKPVTESTRKKLNSLIIILAILAGLYFVVERIFFLTSGMAKIDESKAGTASIAVLPFVNRSNDKNNEYFSDGLSEELLNKLGKVENLRVTGRTSSFQFKGDNKNITTIGNELKVDNILEGSVQKSDSTIKITAQLIKVSDGFNIWSETYERELNTKNIFSIQAEISNTVLKELKVHLLPAEIKAIDSFPTENIDAYNAFLEGTQLVIGDELPKIEEAIKKYQEAIKLDPNFSEAYARLAIAYLVQLRIGNIPIEDSKVTIRENIDRAILIDANTGRAYDALGRFYLQIDESDLALQAFEKAVSLLPNDGDVLDGYHIALERNDRYDEGVIVQKKAYDQDPLNPDYATHYANHISEDNPEAALEIYGDVIQRYPEYATAYYIKSNLISTAPYGKIDEAFELMYSAYLMNPENLGFITGIWSKALDLNMTEWSVSLEEKMSILFPENNAYIIVKIYNQFMANNNQKVLQLIQQNSDQLADDLDIDRWTAVTKFKIGDFKEAKKFFENSRPEMLDSSVVITSSRQSFYAVQYAILLKMTGNLERYEVYKNALCDYKDNLDPEDVEPVDYKSSVLACEILNNPTEALKLMTELYFEDKEKVGILYTLEFHIGYLYLKGETTYPAYKEAVDADLEDLKNNAIQSLKRKDIWKESFYIDGVKLESAF
jgi:TolB-like protein/tetratricopeptide (TPR) repeat protein